jgi:hypothetical protein
MENFLESATWVIVVAGLLWFLLIIYCLFDIFKSPAPLLTKLLWVIIVFLAPFLGCIAYLILGRRTARI